MIRAAILTLEIDVSLTLWPHLFYIKSSWTQIGRDIPKVIWFEITYKKIKKNMV
jgi:hypothetical protein